MCLRGGVSGLVVRLFPAGHASSRVNFCFFLSSALPPQIADAAKVAKEAMWKKNAVIEVHTFAPPLVFSSDEDKKTTLFLCGFLPFITLGKQCGTERLI